MVSDSCLLSLANRFLIVYCLCYAAIVLALGSAVAFVGALSLVINPPLPNF